MNRLFVLPNSLCVAVVALAIVPGVAWSANVVRSNGKGGGVWSAPTTWQGGKPPAGEAVVILGNDVVDLDPAAGKAVKCEELTIDREGALRVVGKDKMQVTVTLDKALRVFGGMMVDFSRDPDGRCEFQWSTNAAAPEIQASDGCQIVWKGGTNATPNVAFRITTTNGLPAGTPVPKSVVFPIGTKMSVECSHVEFEGFDFQVVGVDGSGTKFNERCSFRDCRFIRSPVLFQTCSQIGFLGNHSQDSPTYGVYYYGVTQSRFVSNVVERAGPSAAGFNSYGSVECEVSHNTVRQCYYGMNIVSSADLFLAQDVFEGNAYGLFLNSCARITSQRSLFLSNTVAQIAGAYETAGDPMRFYDCDFRQTPTNAGTACINLTGVMAFELINSPLQTYAKDGRRGPIVFSAYIDILVTNEQNVPLGRIPIRVLSGTNVVATSRTESVGAMTGHTPLPSSHRPLVVPWYRFAPQEGLANPPASLSYQVEVDGAGLGYGKQTVPLVVDASYVRPDPEKPNKTLTVRLPKAK